MAYKNLIDLHVHTDNSYDGHHSAVFLCESAAELGLRAVAFTDHVEMDFYRDNKFDISARQAYFETVKARSAFTGKLIVCAGIELGQPTYNLPDSEQLVQLYSYDIILASIHNLRMKNDFWLLPRDKPMPTEEIHKQLRGYFKEMLQLVQWGKFDVMTHMTYPLRYMMTERGLGMVDLTPYKEIMDAILETAAQKNIALEINTASLRTSYGKIVPDESIVQRFKQLGGKRITVGSDAHYAHHLGKDVDSGMDMALRCGFTHVTLFQQREALEIAIE
ncbi:MAG: histidinol-phosphatase HisJ family protein [Oscillospiraceae bacterium]|nr:histidinol-phosphatase HisJ family protein [Oscillospiraceae bacterium]